MFKVAGTEKASQKKRRPKKPSTKNVAKKPDTSKKSKSTSIKKPAPKGKAESR
jgi:hypothetical protein